MNATNQTKRPPEQEPTADDERHRAATELLDVATTAVNPTLLLDIDPRLNQPSETEAELRELVEAEESAEAELNGKSKE